MLTRVLGEAWVQAFLSCLEEIDACCDEAQACDERVEDATIIAHDATFDGSARKQAGIYFTPAGVSEGMAAAIPSDTPAGHVILDLSAGDGGLLRAGLAHRPDLCCLGVEREPALALACALSLIEARVSLGQDVSNIRDRVLVADGLSLDVDVAIGALGAPIAVILGNPPYVGEKGNRQLFSALKSEHAHLQEFFRARIDLSYLFLHRALDLLPEGGRLVYLTSEYWLMASGADALRDDLATRSALELFLRVDGQPLFQDAPGHHSLITVARKTSAALAEQAPRAIELRAVPTDARWPEVMREALDGELDEAPLSLREPALGWQPFGEAELRRCARAWRTEYLPLESFVQDRQGFVSGADRVTRRHLRVMEEADEDTVLPALGAPLFLMTRDEIPAPLAALGDELVKPLIRGSEVVSGRIWLTPPGEVFGLYIDGDLEGQAFDAATEHLSPVRPVLEQRREVERGRMPWYRLHWPRARSEQQGPKLVCARRAGGPVFGLDVSGSFVSSDCTYLVAREGARHPVRELLRVLIALSIPETWRDLVCFGKRKGALYELYSEPLRSVPLALTFSEDGGEVVFAREEERMAWEDAIARCERVIASSDRSPDGPSFLDLFDESNVATE